MSVIVYAETSENQFKKSTLEALSFAGQTAEKLGLPVVAVVIGNSNNPGELGKYGADEIIAAQYDGGFDAQVYSGILAEICKEKNGKIVVISNSYAGKSLSGRLAVKLQAGLATNVIGYPDTSNGFVVKRGVFSGKAFGYVNLTSEVKVLGITPNSFEIKEQQRAGTVSAINPGTVTSTVKVVSVNKVSGKIPLTEAEIVVSGGRGMKGPENWAMIEELADILGGATACSKPVSDMHWRPHSEHVGQTGITIKPNLYIAVGISGAIQHLAGVSSSKVIVAINKDPEAPFFKAADYGIVGDAFEVLPKVIEAAKAAKG